MLCCGKKKDVIVPKPNSNVPPTSPKNNTDTKKSQIKQSTNQIRQSNNPTNQIKAVKVFGVNGQVQTNASIKGFKAIPETKVSKYGLQTRPQNYTEQSGPIHKSHLIGETNELNFSLQDPFGVANTFEMPTFDYDTLLSHNILSRMNSKSKYQYDDGNEVKLKNSK